MVLLFPSSTQMDEWQAHNLEICVVDIAHLSFCALLIAVSLVSAASVRPIQWHLCGRLRRATNQAKNRQIASPEGQFLEFS